MPQNQMFHIVYALCVTLFEIQHGDANSISENTLLVFLAGEISGWCEYKVTARSLEMKRHGGIYWRTSLKLFCVGQIPLCAYVAADDSGNSEPCFQSSSRLQKKSRKDGWIPLTLHLAGGAFTDTSAAVEQKVVCGTEASQACLTRQTQWVPFYMKVFMLLWNFACGFQQRCTVSGFIR